MQAGENEGCDDREAKINTALPGALAAITPPNRRGFPERRQRSPARPCAELSRRGFAHLGGKEPRKMSKKPALPFKRLSSRTGFPHASSASSASSSSFLFGHRSGLG